MTKYIMTSWLVFVPFVAMAADHCTNPTEYTVDERCYVTDAQKKTSPYNAVVALIDDGDIYCTGTIVQGVNGKPYVYTAKHCTDDDNGLVQSTLRIKLQNGKKLSVTKNNVGNYDIINDENFSGDWAVYSINKTDVPMVEKTTKIKFGIAPYELPYDVKSVGYGSLKIMSDKEITKFKDKYIAYLKDKEEFDIRGTEYNYGFDSGGINTSNEYVINFIDNNDDYWETLDSDDSRLKVSICKYLSTGRPKGCQIWGGNSGGPIFDDENKIMGIVTRGNSMIGGEYHAGREDWWTADFNASVDLLK